MYNAMVIDDDKENVTLLEKVLKKYGVFNEILVYTDPLEAFRSIKSISPDVIFTDVEMPGMSGLELAQYVMDKSPATKLVFITAYDYYAIEAFELYAVDYILKPIKAERLDRTITRLISSNEKEFSNEILTPLIINSFGKLEIFNADKTIKWSGAKTEELFAYLLHYAGQNVTKDTIVDLMWPEYGYRYALRNMQTAMCRVRQSLNELGDYIDIEYSCNCYVLKMKNVNFDCDEFQYLVDSIENISEENLKSAINALAMYNGDYLATNGYLWALPRQTALKNKADKLLKKILIYWETSKDKNYFIGILSEYFDKNPNNETLKFLFQNCQPVREKIKPKKNIHNLLSDKICGEILERSCGLILIHEIFLKTLREKRSLSICLVNMCTSDYIEDKDEKLNECSKIDIMIKSIMKYTRNSDFIVKLRGNEFLVVFQDTEIEYVEKVWKRISDKYSDPDIVQKKFYLICINEGNARYNFEPCNDVEKVYFQELRQQAELYFDEN